MTSSTTDRAVLATRRAAVNATQAPSIHNTQPWQLAVRPDGLDVLADFGRQLTVLDRSGRQLAISVGCALLNARASFAAEGLRVDVDRVPGSLRTGPAATLRISPDPVTPDDELLAGLGPVIKLRHSNRRHFTDELVPDEIVDELGGAAAAEGARLFPVRTEEHRLAVARLSQLADREENGDPAYRAELRRWTSNQADRTDGISALVVPHVDGHAEDEVPLRDFDTYGSGWLPSRTQSSRHQCLLLLGTDSDTPVDWIRAGEALERVLLDITRHGYVASMFSQPVELPHVREQLRVELGLQMHPHMLLRVGRAAATPSTLRRPLADVLIETPLPDGLR